VGVFATTLLTLFGAFIGHKLIRPTRFLISLRGLRPQRM
jgi:hypothetical protein